MRSIPTRQHLTSVFQPAYLKQNSSLLIHMLWEQSLSHGRKPDSIKDQFQSKRKTADQPVSDILGNQSFRKGHSQHSTDHMIHCDTLTAILHCDTLTGLYIDWWLRSVDIQCLAICSAITNSDKIVRNPKSGLETDAICFDSIWQSLSWAVANR